MKIIITGLVFLLSSFSLIWLIFCFVKKKKIWIPLISYLISFGLVIAGIYFFYISPAEKDFGYATIIETTANLRPQPHHTGFYGIRIPVGTKMKILDVYKWRSPKGSPGKRRKVIWYKVMHRGNTGWISEYSCKRERKDN